MEAPIDVVVLVHGTFAREADWVKPESPICQALVEAFPGVDLPAFEWTGDNLQSIREREATRLRTHLLNLGGDDALPRNIAIIAHSHGGNVVVEAIRGGPSIPGLQGVICLATPFLRFGVLPGEAPMKMIEDLLSLWPVYLMWGLSYFVAFGHTRFGGRST